MNTAFDSMSGIRQGVLLAGGLAVTTVPGVGETLDTYVILDPTSTFLERLIASGSLTLNVVTAGVLPNAGGVILAARGLGSLDELSRAAGALDRGGLSAAGRQLQKHGSRPDSAFPSARGNPAAINRQAQDIVDDLLTTPGTTSVTRHHARFGNVLEIRTPDGRGVRYSADGRFLGFLEPQP